MWDHLTKYTFNFNADTNKYVFHYDPAIRKSINFTQDIVITPLWELVKCKVLVVRGKDSDIFPLEAVEIMKKTSPDLDFIEFEDAGHAPSLMVDHQIQYLTNWLNKQRNL